MKNIVLKFIPTKIKRAIKIVKEKGQSNLNKVFASTGFTSSLYYTFISRSFSREHKATLAGKVAYHRKLYMISQSSSLLRRNIHRIEKGLIMFPRRDVFAENYIFDTVNVYSRAIFQGSLDAMEKKWAFDVLDKYFKEVLHTEPVRDAYAVFQSAQNVDSEFSIDQKFTPYDCSERVASKITYEDLTALFIRRRSVRWYTDQDVDYDEVVKAVELAKFAPSACNRQPFRFYVTTDRNKAVRIAKCAGGTSGWADNIHCMVVVVGDLSSYFGERDRHLIYLDGGFAAMQFMLALETLGLSSCPINWPDVDSGELKMKSILNLAEYERPIMLISIGYPSETGGIPYSAKKSNSTLIKKI